MSGIIDLKEALQSLKVACDDVEYGFVSLPDEFQIEREEVLATFHEDERLAVIAPKKYLDAKDIENEGPYAKLTIDIHTSMEMVGLTAAMATRLAEHGISANVVAAFYHDHVFVPFDVRSKATKLLEDLKNG